MHKLKLECMQIDVLAGHEVKHPNKKGLKSSFIYIARASKKICYLYYNSEVCVCVSVCLLAQVLFENSLR